MALIWADGFDQYGSAEFWQQAGYQTAQTLMYQNTPGNARTGDGYIRAIANGTVRVMRKAITTPTNIIGVGCGVQMRTVVAGDNTANGIVYEVTSGVTLVSIVPNNALGFSAVLGNGTVVGVTANNLFNLNSWYWLETKVIMNSGVNTNDASLEIRFQGVTVLIVNGLNFNGLISFITLGCNNGFPNGEIWFDDYVLWDSSGVRNNDFIGDRRCLTTMTNADTALAAWVPSVGTEGFSILDNVPPIDTDYVEAVNPGDISEFEKTPISINTNDIAAVLLFSRVAKIDAGTSTFRMGVHSGAFVNNSDELAPGTAASYFQRIWELDPNGDIPWTRVNVDNALIRLERVA